MFDLYEVQTTAHTSMFFFNFCSQVDELHWEYLPCNWNRYEIKRGYISELFKVKTKIVNFNICQCYYNYNFYSYSAYYFLRKNMKTSKNPICSWMRMKYYSLVVKLVRSTAHLAFNGHHIKYITCQYNICVGHHANSITIAPTRYLKISRGVAKFRNVKYAFIKQ